ncbi:MAG: hypothetical protein BAJALOKI1v1_340020 [Promethearchaeota archaeon]|nr:MAG: hypothetical protein BAJALOKI1v1_340020 [Candidatus Lokiarchaeota archaeon]
MEVNNYNKVIFYIMTKNNYSKFALIILLGSIILFNISTMASTIDRWVIITTPSHPNTSASLNYNLAINTTWNATSFDVANDIAVDSNGNIYITGFLGSITGLGPSDAFLAKFDKNGNHIWNRTWVKDLVDEAEAIVLDENDNIYITGYNRSLLGSTAFIAKYDTNGNSIKNVSWSMSTLNFAQDITIDSSGNIYITGQTGLTQPTTDVFIAKYNDSLDLQMNITWGFGSGPDSASGIDVDNNGDIYISGTNESITGDSDTFIAKFDNEGNPLMNISHQFSSSNSSGLAIDIDRHGNSHIVGYNGSIFTMTNAFVAKYDNSGNSLWNITNFYPSNNSIANDIVLDSLGNVYVSGWRGDLNSRTDAFIIKSNSAGSLLLNITHEVGQSNSSAEAITLDSNGNIYITGYNGSLISSQDAFIAKYLAPVYPLLFLILPPYKERIPAYPIGPISLAIILTLVICLIILKKKLKMRLFQH